MVETPIFVQRIAQAVYSATAILDLPLPRHKDWQGHRKAHGHGKSEEENARTKLDEH